MALLINGERIPGAVLDQEFGNVKSHFERMGNFSCCERDDEFRGYARDNVVARTLLNQAAREKTPEPTGDEIDAAVAKLKDEHGGEAQFYQNYGISAEHEHLVRADVAATLRLDILLEEICAPEPEPSDAELRACYDENLDDYLTEEEVRAAHIFLQVRRVEDRNTLFERLRGYRKRALAGEDFMALAEEARAAEKAGDPHAAEEEDEGDCGEGCGCSGEPQADEERIDLGFFKRGEIMEEFELVAFSMETGEVSPVFVTHYGYHLAKVLERKDSEPKPFEDVKDDLRERILADHRREKINAFVEDLKKSAQIEDAEDDEVDPELEAMTTVRAAV
ncbi:MAG: peptidyl-prolyl cis-trans isomerase [Verrucomicrobiales bacterium]